MAKTIKFNLVCDGKTVRTLEDLRNNFSIEDILGYYKNGLLERWLTVRGYSGELEKVKNIGPAEDSALIRELIEIFKVSTDREEIDKDIYILEYLNEKKRMQQVYMQAGKENADVVKRYFEEYTRLVNQILEHKDNMPLIKANLQIIDDDYSLLFRKDYRHLFYIFYKKAPMAIFVMLLRENMKKLLLPAEDEEKMSEDKEKIYKLIQSLP